MQPVIKIINLSKSYSLVPVFSGVDLDLDAGEVLGIAGRSGTGKTALATIIGGLLSPTEGEMFISGKKVRWPFDARKYGIELIPQSPEIVNELDITSNVFMGNEVAGITHKNGKFINGQKWMDQTTAEILQELNFEYDSLRHKALDLTGEQRQMLAIARAMVKPAKIMVIDDITAMLNYPNQQKVLSLIQIWRDEGRSVLYFSNNLDHLFAVTDEILVICDSTQTRLFRTDETGRDEVVGAMVGTTDQEQITPFIWALDNFYRARQRAEELRQNQILLQRDLFEQDTINKQLINQLNKQVLALDEANRALQDAHRRLISRRELERKRLARDLHDETIQDLFTVNYQLERLEGDSKISAPVANKIRDIRLNIRDLIDDLRVVCGNLRPPTIDSLGVGAAITSFVNDWSKKTGLQAVVDIDNHLIRLPEETELSIYRIVQEVLRNVEKHAQASKVVVSLQHTSPRALMLAISDNGVGLPENFNLSTLQKQGHYGLLGISERVALLGGNMSILNLVDGGLMIQAEIPHPREKKSVN